MTVMDMALTVWGSLGANKEEFILSLVLLFVAKAGKGKLATAFWLLGVFFLLDSLGLWGYFLDVVSQKVGIDLTSLSFGSIKDAIGGMLG